MLKNFFISFIFITNLYAQDFGDASDGVCNFSGLQAKATWNCTDINVTGNTTFPGTNAVVLKATGDVVIQAGGILSVSASGTTPGPGGGNGGACVLSPNCTQVSTNAPGSLGGEGAGGFTGNDDSGVDIGVGGGGGAGGTYNPVSSGANGTIGSDGGGGSTQGPGGVANTTGYGSEADFSTSMLGGVGGGAGGSGHDAAGPSFATGGAGGSGGGIIKIFANGSIDIVGAVTANGGSGSNGASSGNDGAGGGGGGSGGSIYIYTLTSLTVSGSVTSTGGAAGAGGGLGGAGGVGGHGRIRIDTLSGLYTNTGTITPNAVAFIAIPPSESGINFPSDIEYGCVYKGIETESSFILTFLFSLILILGIPRISFKVF